MELPPRNRASYVALAAELCSLLCIAVGMVETLVQAADLVIGRGEARAWS